RKARGILLAQLCEAIIDHHRQGWRFIRRRQGFERGHRERQDLAVFTELVHHFKAGIEVHDGGGFPNALADVLRTGWGIDEFVEEASGKEVVENVDLHRTYHCIARAVADRAIGSRRWAPARPFGPAFGFEEGGRGSTTSMCR